MARENIPIPTPKQELKIGTFNLKNFKTKGDENQTHWVNYFKSLDFDLLAVQEVLDENSLKEIIKLQYPKYTLKISNNGGFGEQKLGFLYHSEKLELLDFQEIKGKESFQNLRPFVLGRFKQKGGQKEWSFITVHLKAGGKEKNRAKRVEQLEYLDQLLKGPYATSIVLGDFNSTHWFKKDSNVKLWSNENKMNGTFQKEVKCSTFYRKGKVGLMEPSLLDHIFVPKGLQLEEVRIHGPCAKFQCIPTTQEQLNKSQFDLSDHCPLTGIIRH